MTRRVVSKARRPKLVEELEAFDRELEQGETIAEEARIAQEVIEKAAPDVHKMSAAEVAALATEALLVEASLARNCPKRFFTLVAREERTRSPITCLPHLQLMLDFISGHTHCVVRGAIECGKTYGIGMWILWMLGNDPTHRAAVVSAAQEQSMKPLRMVSDHITDPLLASWTQLVFPRLRKTRREQEPWTQTAITVERPAGIRDPSLKASMMGGALPGSRLSIICVDDILTQENTATSVNRTKIVDFFDSTILTRLDQNNENARCIVSNTPWHQDDLTHVLQRRGWPTLVMSADGNIELFNADKFIADKQKQWDSHAIVPSSRIDTGREPGFDGSYRLAAHAPDPHELKSLWDLKYNAQALSQKRQGMLPARFNQVYLCQVRDDETARCKYEWIEGCKEQGRGLRLVERYDGGNLTVTGVDFGIGVEARHDKTAIVTIELLPNGKRRILHIESGRWDGPTIMRKLGKIVWAMKSIVRVESNQAQKWMQDFLRAANASFPVKAMPTGKNKRHPVFGIEGLFVELQNKAWIIPCDHNGKCHAEVQQLVNDCLDFTPEGHAGDTLMATWIAREQARSLGDGKLGGGRAPTTGLTNLMAR